MAEPVISPPPDERLALGSLFRRDPRGGVLALFAGRRVALTYSTRVAIRAACDALGLKPGDEILVPAYNCGSEVDPLLHAGLKLVLYPVGGDTTVDPDQIEPLITPHTRALYLTHYFGFPQPATQALRDLCDRHGLVLMEDCALSLLSHAPARLGHLGDAAFYCFYKYFPVHAGGALVLNRTDVTLPSFAKPPALRPAVKLLLLAAVAGLLGQRGIAALKSLRRRLRPERAAPPAKTPPDMPGDYYFDPALMGMRISALASRPLGSFDVEAAIALRRRNFRAYLDLLGGIEGVTPLFADLPEGVCPLNFPVLIDNRDRVSAALATRGIIAPPWWAGYHGKLDFTPFAQARHLKDHVLALPLHQALTPAHLQGIVTQLVACQDLARFQAPE